MKYKYFVTIFPQCLQILGRFLKFDLEHHTVAVIHGIIYTFLIYLQKVINFANIVRNHVEKFNFYFSDLNFYY